MCMSAIALGWFARVRLGCACCGHFLRQPQGWASSERRARIVNFLRQRAEALAIAGGLDNPILEQCVSAMLRITNGAGS